MSPSRISFAAVLSSFCISIAYGLSSGQYSIEIANYGICDDPKRISSLVFYNRTCGAQAGPIIREGEKTWNQWTVTVTHNFADGSVLAKISNYFKKAKAKCYGGIAVGNLEKCKDSSAKKVSLRTKGSTWRIVPVGSTGAYRIIAEGRNASCFRYLGVGCRGPDTFVDTYVGLFPKDDGTGAQRWTFRPTNIAPPSPSLSPSPSPSPSSSPSAVASPPPPASQPLPSKPGGINTVYVDAKMWYVTWVDGTIGKAATTSKVAASSETYTLKCTYAGMSCDGPDVGNTVTGIPRGVEQGTVSGLPDATALNCFVIAVTSAGSVCSDPVPVTTLSVDCPAIPGCLRYDEFCKCDICKADLVPKCLKYDTFCKCSSCDVEHCTKIDYSTCACTECENASYPSYALDKGVCRAYAAFALTGDFGVSHQVRVCSNDSYNDCDIVSMDNAPSTYFYVGMTYNYKYGKYYFGFYQAAVTVCDEFNMARRRFTGCRDMTNTLFQTKNRIGIYSYGDYFYFPTISDGLIVCKGPEFRDEDCSFVVPGPYLVTFGVAFSNNKYYVGGGINIVSETFIYACNNPDLTDCSASDIPTEFVWGMDVDTDGDRAFFSDTAGIDGNEIYVCNSSFKECKVLSSVSPFDSPAWLHYFNNKVFVSCQSSYPDKAGSLVCELSADNTKATCKPNTAFVQKSGNILYPMFLP